MQLALPPLLTSKLPIDDWGELLGDTAAATAMLDRLLHHAHVLKCGPKSWRTKLSTPFRGGRPHAVNTPDAGALHGRS